MALLLAMYQKMRLTREKNQATLELSKYTGKVDRIAKNIERVQKRYTSLFAQIDSQAKMMQSRAKVGIQNMFGLGANSVNPYSYNGLSQFVLNAASGYLSKSGVIPVGKNNDKTDYYEGMDPTKFSQMLTEYKQYGKFLPLTKEEDGKEVVVYEDAAKTIPKYKNGWAHRDVIAFNSAIQEAQNNQQAAQWQCNQMSNQYDSNVSIWQEAAKAQLEAEQDAVLEPLNYEQTMMELEKEQAEQKLQRINANIESYKQLCSEEARNSAPSFGLG